MELEIEGDSFFILESEDEKIILFDKLKDAVDRVKEVLKEKKSEDITLSEIGIKEENITVEEVSWRKIAEKLVD